MHAFNRLLYSSFWYKFIRQNFSCKYLLELDKSIRGCFVKLIFSNDHRKGATWNTLLKAFEWHVSLLFWLCKSWFTYLVNQKLNDTVWILMPQGFSSTAHSNQTYALIFKVINLNCINHPKSDSNLALCRVFNNIPRSKFQISDNNYLTGETNEVSL